MVDILMATYNGEPYLRAQIDSILIQDFSDWQLIVKDDGSTDQTLAILREYQAKYPEKIVVYTTDAPSGSAKNNFFRMLSLAKQPYILFCDQDDVWYTDKITKTMQKMRQLEAKYGKETPLLVHTDLQVVDQDLQTISPSFFRMQKFNLQRTSLQQAVVQNIVTGCTTMVNRSLLSLAGSGAPDILMHDWWLFLIASAFGRVGVIDMPTIQYRQHGRNTLGAKKVGENATSRAAMADALQKTYQQAAWFLHFFADLLSEKDKRLLTVYTQIPNHNKLTRIWLLFRYGFWKHSLIRRLGQLYAV